VRVAGVEKVVLPRPVATARRVGRFAVELWIGRELVDRVRFDFPLLAGEGAPPEGARRPLHPAPSMGGVESHERVRVPDSDRATYAVLVDRLAGTSQPLEWPPKSAHADGSNGE
jgi:hypothetical protein